MTKLPSDYYCPQCGIKATRDLVAAMKEDGIPTNYTVFMAINILIEAKCPVALVKPIALWSKTYGKHIDTLNEEEQDKLRLIKWNQWVKK